MSTSLLSGTSVSLISSPYDSELQAIAAKLAYSAPICGRGDVEVVLCELLAITSPAVTPHRTLDLIGHSSPEGVLRLGSWVIDGAKPQVTAFFRELADLDVMRRLGVRALRLLGCETAKTALGRSTVCALAEILGIEVLGTRVMVGAAHYTPNGFSNDCMYALVAATELRGSCSPLPSLHGEPYRRTLDIGALPASPMAVRTWATATATTEQAREIVRLIGRNDGAYMPGLPSEPAFEIGLPSTSKLGWYHTLQLVLDGAFVRVFPDNNGPGVVFPVSDPTRLRELSQQLRRL